MAGEPATHTTNEKKRNMEKVTVEEVKKWMNQSEELEDVILDAIASYVKKEDDMNVGAITIALSEVTTHFIVLHSKSMHADVDVMYKNYTKLLDSCFNAALAYDKLQAAINRGNKKSTNKAKGEDDG